MQGYGDDVYDIDIQGDGDYGFDDDDESGGDDEGNHHNFDADDNNHKNMQNNVFNLNICPLKT